MLRGLVRQQEDATRLLGEKMRNEAQEHVSAETVIEDCVCLPFNQKIRKFGLNQIEL